MLLLTSYGLEEANVGQPASKPLVFRLGVLHWCYEDAGEGVKHDPNAEVMLVNSLCVTRAFEQEIVLIYSVRYDGAEERPIGRSQITVPFRGALARLDHNQEAMFIQTVDTAILQDAERSYEIRRDLRERLNSR